MSGSRKVKVTPEGFQALFAARVIRFYLERGRPMNEVSSPEVGLEIARRIFGRQFDEDELLLAAVMLERWAHDLPVNLYHEVLVPFPGFASSWISAGVSAELDRLVSSMISKIERGGKVEREAQMIEGVDFTLLEEDLKHQYVGAINRIVHSELGLALDLQYLQWVMQEDRPFQEETLTAIIGETVLHDLYDASAAEGHAELRRILVEEHQDDGEIIAEWLEEPVRKWDWFAVTLLLRSTLQTKGTTWSRIDDKIYRDFEARGTVPRALHAALKDAAKRH